MRVWNRPQEPQPNKEKADTGFVMPANSEPEMFAGSWLEEQKSQHGQKNVWHLISDKRSKHENQTDEKAAGLWPDVSLDLNELKIASPS